MYYIIAIPYYNYISNGKKIKSFVLSYEVNIIFYKYTNNENLINYLKYIYDTNSELNKIYNMKPEIISVIRKSNYKMMSIINKVHNELNLSKDKVLSSYSIINTYINNDIVELTIRRIMTVRKFKLSIKFSNIELSNLIDYKLIPELNCLYEKINIITTKYILDLFHRNSDLIDTYKNIIEDDIRLAKNEINEIVSLYFKTGDMPHIITNY